MKIKNVQTYWAIKLRCFDPPVLAGVWYWRHENPKALDGIALFRTRQQAREHFKDGMGPAVKVKVTIEEL